MNKDVAKSDHPDPLLLGCFIDEPVFAETAGNVPAVLDGPAVLLGDHMAADIQRGLDRQLKKAFRTCIVFGVTQKGCEIVSAVALEDYQILVDVRDGDG